MQEKLTRETHKKLRMYGVSVFWAAVTDFAECIVIKNISSNGQHGAIITHNME